MDKIIGFIGAGNMTKAMIGGIIHSKISSAEHIIVSNPHQPKLQKISKEYGVLTTTNNKEVAQKSDILILSVKPKISPIVIEEIKEDIKKNVVIVSIVAGKTIASIEQSFGKTVKVVRAMPNTPALVGEAMSCVDANKEVSREEIQEIISLFQSFGEVEEIDEGLMDVVTAIGGSLPAYIYMFIEAIADGAVKEGMLRDKAYKIISQAVLGSAKMVLETGEHPGKLKDMVTSPGGTTIEAVASLESSGFRAALIQAVQACTQKSRDMA